MNELKNLISVVIAAIWCAFAPAAQAQILGMGVNFEKLNLPEKFFQNLSNCKDYNYSYSAGYEDVKVKTAYSVTGNGNSCKLHIDALSNVEVHITQDCDFTLQQAKDYAEALRRYQSKGYSPRWDAERLQNDVDYQAAYKIMSDRNICRFHRDEIDNTKNLREQMLGCKPAMQTEATAGLEIKRQILGVEDSQCHYQFSINQLEITDSANGKKQKGGKVTFDCRLNLGQNARYLRIMEAMVVPAEDGYDFSAIQRIWPQAELEFVLENCSITDNSAAQ